MRKTLIVVAVVVLLLGIVAAWPWQRAMGQVPAQVQRWEYATLDYTVVNQKTFHSFRSASDKFDEKSPEDLLKKLGGTGEETGSVVLFNLIGNKGWELVQMVETKNSMVNNTTWYFKRPLR